MHLHSFCLFVLFCANSIVRLYLISTEIIFKTKQYFQTTQKLYVGRGRFSNKVAVGGDYTKKVEDHWLKAIKWWQMV